MDPDQDEASRIADPHRSLLLRAEGYHGLHGKLVDRFGSRVGEALYSFFASGLAIGVSAFLAWFFKQPLLFPSLGPTAYLCFESPMSRSSSPRNTIIGHFVAVVAGGISLAIFGLIGAPTILEAGPTVAYVSSGTLSVALTGGALLLLRASHPPAEATTLIVSLALLNTPKEILVLMTSVVILTVVGWLINRASGVPVPIWLSKD